MQKTKLFYCYAHARRDKSLQDQLAKQLAPLKHLGLIAEWSDRDILAGQSWRQEIDQRINTADIILLLISSDFIASNYCSSIEMKRALERHEAGEARVIPIILRPVDWQILPIGELQALPTEGKPITMWANREEAFLAVAQGIRRVIEAFLPISEVCPYRGLADFTEQYHRFFYGRERALDTILSRLRSSTHFLALLGPSGGGKSSLVQAGLIPYLRQGTWLGVGTHLEAIISRPDRDPFAELALRGLPGISINLTERVRDWRNRHPNKERLILVIDQFEEIWTNCSPKIVQDFTNQLVALVQSPESANLTLILIVRDDFSSRFERHVVLAELVEQSRVRVPPTLRRSELLAIIQEPAKAQKLYFDEGLVDMIIEDVLAADSTEVDGELVTYNTILPLLEFALFRLWDERQDREMTREAYKRIGRVSGGLTVWADNVLSKLDTRLQLLARAIFTKLIHLGDESQHIPHSRRRRTLDELYPEQKDTHFVIARLAEARLLVTSRDPQDNEESVEIIHDVLLHKWNKLQIWIAEDRSFLAWRQEFEKRVDLWIETDPHDPILRDEGRLLRGRDLEDAERWLAEHVLDFSLLQQNFIQTSRKQVDHQRQSAIARRLVAHSESIRTQQPELVFLSVILAAEAMKRSPSIDVDQALRSAMASTPRPLLSLAHKKMITSLAFSPDGRELVTASADCHVIIWRIPYGIRTKSLVHQGPVNALAFSPDGRRLATASSDHTVGVWSAVDWHHISFLTHQSPVKALIFSPDSQHLATASEDNRVAIWRWQEAGNEPLALLDHIDHINSLAFSPDGQYLATASSDGSASVWKVPGGERIIQLQHHFRVLAVTFSPDGRYLVTASEDGNVSVWEVPDGQQLHNLKHEWQVGALAFSPDGRYLVTVGGDRFARVWEMPAGILLTSLEHLGNTHSAAFSPDGQYLATGGEMTRVCKVKDWHQIAYLLKCTHIHSVTFSPNGKYLATAGQESTAHLWEIANKLPSACLTCNAVKAMIFTSDQKYLITFSGTFAAKWDINRNVCIKRSNFHKFPISLVQFGSDEQFFVSIGLKKNVIIVNMKNRRHFSLPHDHDVNTVVFSQDGHYLATASNERGERGEKSPVVLWEFPFSSSLISLNQEDFVEKILFSPASTYLAIVSSTAGVAVWEMKTHSQLLNIPERYIHDIAFSPDEQYLAFACSGETRVYDLLNNRFAYSLEQMMGTRILFSPNGRYLAGASDDKNACVWEFPKGRLLAYLAHKGEVKGVAFSPDNHYVATASWDNTVGIWEVTTGSQLICLNHDTKVKDVYFSADGKYIASLDVDDTLRLWMWKPEDMIVQAYAHIPRNLTEQEWLTYLGTEPYQKTYPDSAEFYEKASYLTNALVKQEFAQPETDPLLITEQTKQVMLSAEKETQHFQQSFINTEHLVLEEVQEVDTRTTAKGDGENQFYSGQGRQELAQSRDDGALLTEQAKQAILFANKAARSFNHNYIGTEHLLLGLLDEPTGRAGKLLNELGIKPEKVRSALEFIIGRVDRRVPGEIGMTSGAKKALELASHEAHLLNHRSIGTEHLLLGLVREGEGIAAGILESLGINLEKMRTRTIQLLHQSE